MTEYSISESAEPLMNYSATNSSAVIDEAQPSTQYGRRDLIRRDGTACQRDRDAPGQNCVYIPPGFHNSELYRLGTFAKFPAESPVKRTDLAAAGFYWTGYKDRVKCFSCGTTVENWMIGDDGMGTQWHKSTCRMVAGHDIINVPIPEPNFRSLFRQFRSNPFAKIIQTPITRPMDISEEMGRIRINELPKIQFANIIDHAHERLLKRASLRNESERRSTFEKWPSYPAPYLVSELARQGFFYLGNLDRTQCFSCSGVLRNWAPTDDVSEQHKKHYSNCRFARGEYSGNVPMDDFERERLDDLHRQRIASLTTNRGEPPDPPPEEQMRLAERFPCLHPMNPHMKSLEQRIATFDRRWPKQRIRAPIEQMAKAGLFFLGESDKTKCFHCNGGLQNWDRDDEPWTEHAKWFPGCEFVLRMKGIEFVQRLKNAHPNLNRPSIRNPVSLDVPPNDAAQNIDRTELRNMGFSVQQIEAAISRRGNARSSTADIVQDLIEGQQYETATSPMQTQTSVSRQPISAAAGSKREGTPENGILVKKQRQSILLELPAGLAAADGPAMADSLRKMEEAVLCKQCKRNRSEITLIPCGHLCLCESCASNADRCIICKGRIAEKIKVYRA